MDPGLLECVTCVFIVYYLLLGSTCLSATANPSCSCEDIPMVDSAKPPGSNCTPKIHKFRYTCNDGYVRKAGTSNLIQCTDQGWSKSSLICIENPLNPPRKMTPPSSVDVISSVSSETDLVSTSTVLPPQHTPASTTSFGTSRFDVISSVSSETDLETTSTVLPPQHTPGTSLQTTTTRLPQTSTKTPTTALPSTSSPLTSHSTSTISSSTATHSAIMSPSNPSVNKTLTGSKSEATRVITPVIILLIVLAAGGVGCWLYKRKTRNRNSNNGLNSEEECVPMNKGNGGM